VAGSSTLGGPATENAANSGAVDWRLDKADAAFVKLEHFSASGQIIDSEWIGFNTHHNLDHYGGI